MTSWRQDPDAMLGRIAVVAGATRGAGRGIAAAWGEAGATNICSGCSSRSRSLLSHYERPETIEERRNSRRFWVATASRSLLTILK